MSRWAEFYFIVFQNIKRILNLSSVHFGLERLVALFFIALTLTIFLPNGSVVADRLFQSPTSPPPLPAPVQPNSPTVAPPPPTQPPPEQPAPEQVPTEQPSTTTEQSPAQPTTESSESVPETEAPVSEPLPEGSGPPPFAQPTVDTSADSFEDDRRFSVEDEETSSNFILDRVELIDSIVVSGAYVWLCCGIALILLIPLFFLFLQIRGQIKIQREEDF